MAKKSSRRIEETTTTFNGTLYSVAGDLYPVAYRDRGDAEKRARFIDAAHSTEKTRLGKRNGS